MRRPVACHCDCCIWFSGVAPKIAAAVGHSVAIARIDVRILDYRKVINRPPSFKMGYLRASRARIAQHPREVERVDTDLHTIDDSHGQTSVQSVAKGAELSRPGWDSKRPD